MVPENPSRTKRIMRPKDHVDYEGNIYNKVNYHMGAFMINPVCLGGNHESWSHDGSEWEIFSNQSKYSPCQGVVELPHLLTKLIPGTVRVLAQLRTNKVLGPEVN